MNEFFIYLELGFRHVLDINAYDHVLFFIALMIPFTFKEWKDALLLVTVFTFAHTLALILSVYDVVTPKQSVIELLIPITILITALYHLITAGKTKPNKGITLTVITTLFFGIIHGLGFSNYFKPLMSGKSKDELFVPLLEFALGIEVAQLLVVLFVLVLAYIMQNIFRFSRRDWALVLSAFVIGVVLPMIIGSEMWFV
jgi:HupE / UreJ protein